MKNLLETILYIFEEYRKKDELSSARLVLLIFLIDWKFAIDNGKQFTEAKWVYEHFGPFSNDVFTLIRKKNDIFKVDIIKKEDGEITERLFLKSNSIVGVKNFEAKSAADFILENTYSMTWSEFIQLVFSSYPIISNSKNTQLDLSKDSLRFKQRKMKT